MTFLAYTSRQTVTEFELSLHGDDAKHIISCKWYLIIDPRVPLVGARHLTRVKSPTLIALYPLVVLMRIIIIAINRLNKEKHSVVPAKIVLVVSSMVTSMLQKALMAYQGLKYLEAGPLFKRLAHSTEPIVSLRTELEHCCKFRLGRFGCYFYRWMNRHFIVSSRPGLSTFNICDLNRRTLC